MSGQRRRWLQVLAASVLTFVMALSAMHRYYSRLSTRGVSQHRVDTVLPAGMSAMSLGEMTTSRNRTTAATQSTKFDADWLHEQGVRKRLVADVCDKHPEFQGTTKTLSRVLRERLRNFWVSDTYEVVYCPLAKVACSSWRSMLLRLGGAEYFRKHVHIPPKLNRYGLKQLSQYKLSDVPRILGTYRKFLVVRHPYERIHSAFTEKFLKLEDGVGNSIFPPLYGVKIMKKYWKNPTEEDLATGRNISFEDFVRYIGDTGVPWYERLEAHWAPYNDFCLPCVLKYDYILKTETMGVDSENMLRGVFNTTFRLERLNAFQHTNLSAYDHIPREYTERLWDIYGLDFALFGYKWLPH